MKLQEVKQIAQSRGIAPKKMTKTELTRAIQSQEGNIACYDTGAVAACGQVNCLWREDCK